MKNELFEDLMTSLNEALAYEKGDKTKGRSITITIPDDEISTKYNKLGEIGKQKIHAIIDEMLQAEAR